MNYIYALNTLPAKLESWIFGAATAGTLMYTVSTIFQNMEEAKEDANELSDYTWITSPIGLTTITVTSFSIGWFMHLFKHRNADVNNAIEAGGDEWQKQLHKMSCFSQANESFLTQKVNESKMRFYFTSQEDLECLHFISSSFYFTSLDTLYFAWSHSLAALAEIIAKELNQIPRKFQIPPRQLKEAALLYSAAYMRYIQSYFSVDSKVIRSEQGPRFFTTIDHLTLYQNNLLKTIQYFLDKSDLGQKESSFVSKLKTLRRLTHFGIRHNQSTQHILAMITITWDKVPGNRADQGSRAEMSWELFKVCEFWDERFKLLSKQPNFHLKECNFGLAKNLKQAISSDGTLKNISQFEIPLISHLNQLCAQMVENKILTTKVLAKEISREDIIALFGADRRKWIPLQEIIASIFCSFSDQMFLTMFFQNIFNIFEKKILNVSDRFRINPSAEKFIEKIREGLECLEEQTPSSLPCAPTPPYDYGLTQWLKQTEKIHRERIEVLLSWKENGSYGVNLIPQLCKMIEQKENFDGLEWLRLSLICSDLKRHLSEWASEWNQLTIKTERRVIQKLKSLPEAHRKEAAQSIAEWMIERKIEQKPAFDLLCLGRWIDLLALDSLNSIENSEDFSLFFSPDLGSILQSFEPEELLDRIPEEINSAALPVSCHAPKSSSEIIPLLGRNKKKEKTRGHSSGKEETSSIQEVLEPAEQRLPTVKWRHGIKTRNLLRELYDLGFEQISQTGSHLKLVLGGRVVIVPNKHEGQQQGTLRSIAAQAGVEIQS